MLFIKKLLQISSLVLSREVFVSREVKSKIVMWMGSWSWRVCSNALKKKKIFFTGNWLWVRGSRMETRKFCKVVWMSVEKKMRILVGEEDSFYEALVCPYMIIRLFWSREVNWILFMMRNNMFFGDSVDSIF